MTIYEFDNYKSWVNAWIHHQPRGGHGQLRKLSLYLQINSVVMSQVFRGKRDLTLEQALETTKFMGLTELERDYFLLLVQKEKANSIELRELFRKQIEGLKIQAQAIKNRVKHQSLSDEDKSIFYSSWQYSAVRLALSIPHLSSVHTCAEYLNLEPALIAKIIDFLLKHNLIIETNRGYDLGPQVTHVSHDSPFVKAHHNNWRIKGLQSLEVVSEMDLHYTGPMSLSHETAHEIRRLIVDLIEKMTKKVASSKSEGLRCLTIDWFGVGKNDKPKAGSAL